MRVLHLTSGNMYGGVETLLVTLARHRHLCPGMEPHFGLCFEGKLRDELVAAEAPVHLLGNVRIRRPWTVWKARRRLGRLLSEGSFDVVVCHSCWPHALFAKVVRWRKIPLVFWTHDLPIGRHWLEWWAGCTEPDLVLANSKVTQSATASLFSRTRSEVLYYPVPAPNLQNIDVVRGLVRESMQTAEETTVIIQVSRLERWKGHHLLLDALGRLADLPGWACWIAGGAQRPHEQQYLCELREKVSRLGLAGRVQFLGQRGDVPQLLAAADIHCQPNIGPEPFGIVFVEALHARLPVVTTAMGGALEIVEESCGRFVSAGDVEKLADTLGGLIRDGELRRGLGSAGPKRAGQLCDPARQLRLLHQRCSELTETAT
jgi:glycosyltransferase involved in cell wall biosynthesis